MSKVPSLGLFELSLSKMLTQIYEGLPFFLVVQVLLSAIGAGQQRYQEQVDKLTGELAAMANVMCKECLTNIQKLLHFVSSNPDRVRDYIDSAAA
jgi:hypothetical protein